MGDGGKVVSGDFAEYFPSTVGTAWVVSLFNDSGHRFVGRWACDDRILGRGDIADYTVSVYRMARVCNLSLFALAQVAETMGYRHTQEKELELMRRWHTEDGLSPHAIAARLGRNPSTVQRRLAKASGRVGRPPMSKAD